MARRALNNEKRRFPARAVSGEVDFDAKKSRTSSRKKEGVRRTGLAQSCDLAQCFDWESLSATWT
jgi:hypothetical protein